MTADYVIDFIKLGVAVLAGYIAVASFLPSVLDRLNKTAENSTRSVLERREFAQVFERSLNASKLTLSLFAGGYVLTGLGTTVLLGFVALSYIPCRGFTCFTDWVPVFGGLAITLGLLELLITTGSVLTVFAKATRQGLKEVEPDDS